MKTALSPSKLYTAIVRRLHFLVLLALLVPCFCLVITFGMSREDAASALSCFLPLYFLTLSIALPASFMYLLEKKIPNLGVFLLCACPVCLLYLAGLFALEGWLSLSIQGGEKVPQALILLLFLLDAIRMRTNDNSRRKAKVQEDHSWTGDMYLLPLPSIAITIPFAVIYIGALFLHSHELAQTALVGVILYFFIVFPCRVLTGRDEYLEGRHHVSRVPGNRISRLLRQYLAGVLIPCVLLAAAALVTAGGRHFLNLPKFRPDIFNAPDNRVMYEESALLRELLAAGSADGGAAPPAWLLSLLDFIDNALTVVLAGIIFYVIWVGVRSLIIRFRRQDGDSGKPPSPGAAADEHISLKTSGKTVPATLTEGRIRRRYRRTILHFRGQAPDPYETPSLMEERSRLPDTPGMRSLHEEYERARYGPNSKKT